MSLTDPERRSRWLERALLAAGLTLGLLALAWFKLEAIRPGHHYLQLFDVPQRLVAGSQQALRLVVRDTADGAPSEDAEVTLALIDERGERRELGRWRSDAQGVVNASFTVPDDEPEDGAPTRAMQLQIETSSWLERDAIRREVKVENRAELLVSCDKPIYQPGQTIRIRALARRVPSMKPRPGVPLVFELIDPKGNKVARRERETSAYGIAAADIAIADVIRLGRYQLRISRPAARTRDQQSVERTITIKRYVPPPFKVSVAPPTGGQRFARPGELAELTIDAQYLFGKPVAGGEVVVSFDRGAQQRHHALRDIWRGPLDASGQATAKLAIPQDLRFGGRRLELPLTAKVTDPSGHSELRRYRLVVARQGILIDVLPLGAAAGPGEARPLLVSTISADGQPLACDLEIETRAGRRQTRTSALGLARVEIREDGELRLRAAANGTSGSRRLRLSGQTPELLIRSDRALHRVGQTLRLEVLAPGSGQVFVDLVKDQQTVMTASATLEQRRAVVEVPLGGELGGVIVARAYQLVGPDVVRSGALRLFVARDSELQIKAELQPVEGPAPADGTFRPGTRVRYALQLSDREGKPVVGAISSSIVDQAVLALAESAPGMASPAAELERELAGERVEGARLKGVYAADGRSRITFERKLSPGSLARADLDAAERDVAAAALLYQPDLELQQPELEDTGEAKREQVRGDREAWRTFYSSWMLRAFLALALLALLRYGSALSLSPSGGLGATLIVATVSVCSLAVAVVAVASDPALRGLAPSGNLALVVISLIMGHAVAYAILLSGEEGSASPMARAYRVAFAALSWMAASSCVVVVSAEQLNVGPELALAVWMILQAGGLLMLQLIFKELGFDPAQTGQTLGSAALLVGALVATGVFFGNDIKELFYASSKSLRGGTNEKVTYDDEFEGDGFEMANENHDTANLDKDGSGWSPPRSSAPRRATAAPAPLKKARLRKRFVETLLWAPELITDAQGRAELEFELADNITSWRTLFEAVDGQGRLGCQETSFSTFMPFFIRANLPVQLTQNDEIDVPVALFNYAKQAHQVQLELKAEPWFERVGDGQALISLTPGEVTGHSFRVKVKRFGHHTFKISARGTAYADAIQRRIEVLPDGELVEGSESTRLASGTTELTLPQGAIEGTTRGWLKVYPGVASEVVQGLGGLLRMPHG